MPTLAFFFFNDTATTEIYTLSLHDALPICPRRRRPRLARGGACPSRRLSDASPDAAADSPYSLAMTFPARPLREWIMRAFHALLVVAPLAVFGLAPGARAHDGATSHALSLRSDVTYPPDFKQFDYVNPDAPKAGSARFAAVASFDNLNQFIIKGVPAAGIGSVFDTLMTQSLDEPATEYGLLAASVEVAKDRSWVIYTLRKEARFNDGSKVTPDDVIWTFETLRSKGRPQYRGYYADVGSRDPVAE